MRARSRTTNDYITGKLGLRPIIMTARRAGQNPRAVQSLHPSRHHAVPAGKGQSSGRSSCPYHGWTFINNGKLRGVPWPDGYADDLIKDAKFNARAGAARRILSRLHLRHAQHRMPPLDRIISAPIKKPIDEWLDRNPGGKVVVCEANRLKYKGNWKLAYDNSCDGYHVVFSHRSLLEMENRLADESATRACPITRAAPDEQPMYMQYIGQRPSLQGQAPEHARSEPAGCGRWKARIPAWSIRSRSCAAVSATARRGLARSRRLRAGQHQRVSRTCRLLGNHIQVFEPVSRRRNQRDLVRHHDRVDVDGTMGRRTP